MKRKFYVFHNWVAKKVMSRRLRAGTDMIILAASSYLMVKKLFGFSISGWLLNNALQQPLVTGYVVLCGIALSVAILIKILHIYFEYFPPLNHDLVEPDEISDCLYRMNSEIAGHISRFNEGVPLNVKSICEQHAYKVNMGLIIDSLAEHVRKSIGNIRVKRKDLFISLYCKESNALHYMLHYDSKRDLVESRVIDLEDKKYRDYESVKCIRSFNTTAYVLDRKQYAKGASKRHKTIEHYMGCKLSSDEKVFGFLNIEFHNNAIFPDEASMQDFMEEHVFPFKLLLEYQFLKKDFFESFKEFETFWRAA